MIAAIYARKSTEQVGVADDQKSIARQVEHARAYAVSKGWIVADAHVYVDDGISGAEFAKRPGYMRLLNAAGRRAPFDVLIVSEPSRLGREQLETGYAMKQLAEAGVRIFAYLDDREVMLETPLDKFTISALNFGAEMEREKARQRQIDTMSRKARAGHVTGGTVFGYDNVAVLDAAGRRSHVERRVSDAEAAIVHRIFALCADGSGLKAITKTLNRDGALSPRQGRYASWAPSSVREVLFRDMYRGVVVWNRTRKRDKFGKQRQVGRAAGEWITREAPELRIVSDEQWAAAHARLDAARALYLGGTHGRPFGRPAQARTASRYLLTHLALCGECGRPLEVQSRSHGRIRARFYGCAAHRERGTCANRRIVPMGDADAIVIEALLDDVLDLSMIEEAVNEAVKVLCHQDEPDADTERIEQELAVLEREQSRIMAAIATGRQVAGVLEALQALDRRRVQLEGSRPAGRATRATPAPNPERVRDEVLTLATNWRRVLVDDPTHARPIVAALLQGRVTFTPLAERKRWQARGEGSVCGLFSREFAEGLASPAGFEPAFWP
jgi:site-specific DNA recombinase